MTFAPRAVLLALLCVAAGCATLPPPGGPGPERIVLPTPLDGVPIRSRDALPPLPDGYGLEAAREAALLDLRHDLAQRLCALGLDVREVDREPLTGPRPAARGLAALGAGADAVLDVDLIAYGDVRESWLWLLAAQALAAGIGHGVVVGAATGNAGLAWLAGAGEFLIETATWVGGAWFGSKWIDPVLLRARLLSGDGVELGHWTREGTRPLRSWFRAGERPPRADRLRAVAGGVFEKLAAKVIRALARAAPPPNRAPTPQGSRTRIARE